MYTLRTHMINANNTRALPASRYHIQHHNSLQQVKNKPITTQPVRYVKVIKRVLLLRKNKVENKSMRSETQKATQKKKNNPQRKLIHAAKNTWVKGHGTIERIDKQTGDIFHLVRLEAVYEDITQEKTITVETTNKEPTAHFVQIRIPVKIKQTVPSGVLPQGTTVANS